MAQAMSNRTRRLRAALGAAAFVFAGAAAAQTQSWNFEVFLDDSPIGHHHYTLRSSGDGAERELKIEARFNVKFLFINAYRYAHDASERWRGNCLAALTARTDDNGAKSEVDTESQGAQLSTVTSIALPAATRARQPVDGCLMGFAYWNPEMLRQSRLLNAQTGKIETVTITALGEEKISVRGTPTPATRYRVSGTKHPIDLWYGADRAWVALQSTLESGRRLRYQLK
jgi:Family of unknown function (DUF6134)